MRFVGIRAVPKHSRTESVLSEKCCYGLRGMSPRVCVLIDIQYLETD